MLTTPSEKKKIMAKNLGPIFGQPPIIETLILCIKFSYGRKFQIPRKVYRVEVSKYEFFKILTHGGCIDC